MDDNSILYSTNAIRSMEVIDINSGSKLGYVKDFKIDLQEQKIISIILPVPIKNWFSKEDDIEIAWEKISKIGVDVLLVDGTDIEEYLEKNNG